jgi:hypothetical protein
MLLIKHLDYIGTTQNYTGLVNIFTDSQIVLPWIKNDIPIQISSIDKRIHILQTTPYRGRWQYVSTTINPADMMTKEQDTSHRTIEAWLHGPRRSQLDIIATQPVCHILVIKSNDEHIQIDLENLKKAKKILSLMINFLKNIDKKKELIKGELLKAPLQKSTNYLYFKLLQKKHVINENSDMWVKAKNAGL